MHAQQYCLVLESLPSAVLGRPRTARRWRWWLLWLWTGVDFGVGIHLHSSNETFTLHYCTYFAPKSPPSTIALTRNNLHISTRVFRRVYIYKLRTRLVVLITQLQSLRGVGCACQWYRMHVHFEYRCMILCLLYIFDPTDRDTFLNILYNTSLVMTPPTALLTSYSKHIQRNRDGSTKKHINKGRDDWNKSGIKVTPTFPHSHPNEQLLGLLAI